VYKNWNYLLYFIRIRNNTSIPKRKCEGIHRIQKIPIKRNHSQSIIPIKRNNSQSRIPFKRNSQNSKDSNQEESLSKYSAQEESSSRSEIKKKSKMPKHTCQDAEAGQVQGPRCPGAAVISCMIRIRSRRKTKHVRWSPKMKKPKKKNSNKPKLTIKQSSRQEWIDTVLDPSIQKKTWYRYHQKNDR
jgi:hypothetical protein